jgi:TRAP-type C4-dicarboxylate transport system permease small subunit
VAEVRLILLANVVTAVKCIGLVAPTSDEIERDAKFLAFFQLALSFLVAAGLIGTAIALVVSYDSQDPPLTYLMKHWPATALTIIFLLAAIFLAFRVWINTTARRIP